MEKILVVVDCQNDFITGSLGSPEAFEAVRFVGQKVRDAVKNNTPIVFTLDTHDEHYLETYEGKNLPVPHCIKGANGWLLDPRLSDAIQGYRNVRFIEKSTFGSVNKSRLERVDLPSAIEGIVDDNEWFNEEIEVELCGLCTDICVVSNALILRAYGDGYFTVSVDSKACAGTSKEAHESALNVMRSCQIKVA